ncbi:MAG TPA: hypothetical protein VHQ86_04825, partial [Candidatus Saccharimonadia bacterium]|nr:hypothetical protein [Candidatus Saccharimonadia bacterium]
MTINLKTTILASSALAGLLNLGQFAITYDRKAQDAFIVNDVADAAVRPSPVASPTPSASPSATPAPNAALESVQGKLRAAGLNPTFAELYLSVQARTGTPWQL